MSVTHVLQNNKTHCLHTTGSQNANKADSRCPLLGSGCLFAQSLTLPQDQPMRRTNTNRAPMARNPYPSFLWSACLRYRYHRNNKTPPPRRNPTPDTNPDTSSRFFIDQGRCQLCACTLYVLSSTLSQSALASSTHSNALRRSIMMSRLTSPVLWPVSCVLRVHQWAR
jgi:hypothetical protein